MGQDCYEQTHAIDWPAINAMIRSFRQNLRDGHDTMLDFKPDNGRLTLTCVADSGYVGSGVVSRREEADSE